MRNNSLDTFRLFAAFAVVVLHVRYGNMPSVVENNIRLLGRFAVPFFFLVSGYFFHQNFIKKGNEYFIGTFQRLLAVFITSCLVYTLIGYHKLNFTFSLLYQGTNYHLWFLSSMIFGLIICWYHYSYVQSKYLMIVLSVAIIVLSLLSDSYASISPYKLDPDFCRYLLSIPYLYFGALIAEKQYTLTRRVSVTLIILGILSQIVESVFLNQRYGYEVFNQQHLVGTIIFSFGMFFWSFIGFKSNLLAELGRKYALSIYVYHLFVNFFLFRAIRLIFNNSADSILMFSPLISFMVTLLSLIVIDSYVPVLFQILNGNIKMIIQVFHKKTFVRRFDN